MCSSHVEPEHKESDIRGSLRAYSQYEHGNEKIEGAGS